MKAEKECSIRVIGTISLYQRNRGRGTAFNCRSQQVNDRHYVCQSANALVMKSTAAVSPPLAPAFQLDGHTLGIG